jgi:hypothetical protein
METKQFEKGSAYVKYDVDGDGIVTDQELVCNERIK